MHNRASLGSAFSVLTWSVAIAAATLVHLPAAGQTPAENFRSDFWIPNEPAATIAVSTDAIYLGGWFDHVGAHTGAFGVVDAGTAVVAAGIAPVIGLVWNVCADGNGGWYVGGDFGQIGEVDQRHLAHVLPDGTVDPSWTPVVAGEVYAMTRSKNVLYVGGDFTGINGVARANVAAIDVVSGTVLPWAPDANDIVSALAATNSAVYVGGMFDDIGGADRHYLASVDAVTGEAGPWDPAPDVGGVATIKIGNGAVYVGGGFTSIAGAPRRGVASFEESSGALNEWDPDLNERVHAIALAGATVYLGGQFTTVAGQPRLRGAAVDAQTAGLLAWDPEVEGAGTAGSSSIRALACDEAGGVVVGGSFTSIRGVPRLHLARVDGVSGVAVEWSADVANNQGAIVYALAVDGSAIAVGGRILTLGGAPRQAAAALDLQTGELLPWRATLVDRFGGDVTVYDLVHADGIVCIGGVYSDEFNRSQPLLVAVDAASGEPIPGFTPPADPADSIITSLALLDTCLFAGIDMSGPGEYGVYKYNATTGQLLGRAVATNNDVLSLELSHDGSVLYFAGMFDDPRRFAGSVTTNDDLLTTWDPDPDDPVFDLLATEFDVYLGGSFVNVGGEARRRLAAVDPVTGAVLAWDPDIDRRWVNTVELLGSGVVAGGDFDMVGEMGHRRLAIVDRVTGDPTAWEPRPLTEVLDVATSASVLVVGGEFGVLGERPRPHLAVFDLLSNCTPDIDENGAVDFADILRVLANWGPYDPCPPYAPEDLDRDCNVGFGDVLLVLASWGPCSETLGACCFADATCDDEATAADCVTAGGFFLGGGSTCAVNCLSGACCLGDGTCAEPLIREACIEMGGAYQGNGSACIACSVAADTCVNASTMSEGVYFYSTLDATSGGPDAPPECDEGGGHRVVKDVWIRYHASCDGTASVDVCDSTFDTRLLVYEADACPGALVACSDDGCGDGGTRSAVSFETQVDVVYLIRIGSTSQVGQGVLVIGCDP